MTTVFGYNTVVDARKESLTPKLSEIIFSIFSLPKTSSLKQYKIL